MSVTLRGRSPDAGAQARGRPFDRAAVEDACRVLPAHDPIAAQKALCATLRHLDLAARPHLAQLDALCALEPHARRVCDRLLSRYVEGGAQMRTFERRVMVAAMRLCHAMVEAYEHFLPHIERSQDDAWLAWASRVVVHLFFHRQAEFLLRSFRYKRRNADQWRSLHEAYRFARDRGAHRDPVTVPATSDTATPEQQYLQILLLEIMNDGRFSPREFLWAYGWFTRWCGALDLHASRDDGARPAGAAFAVNLDGAEGATRRTPGADDATLAFDPSPLMGLIDDEVASLRAATAAADEPMAARECRITLLARLRSLYSPAQPQVARRGEREAVVATVQALTGLSSIVTWLRESARRNARAGTPPAALDEPTIDAFGGTTRTLAAGAWGASDAGACALPEAWQVKDRSDSGCRMRGRTADLNRVIPGSLLAIRESETAPWTVAMVRRLRRLMVDHVEIAVEHIGRRPRLVKMVNGLRDDTGAASAAASKCFDALYLPPSDAWPATPIRTLLLPAREFRAGGTMTLLSSSAVHILRLHQPIRWELELVWTSFTVVERVASASFPHTVPARSFPMRTMNFDTAAGRV